MSRVVLEYISAGGIRQKLSTRNKLILHWVQAIMYVLPNRQQSPRKYTVYSVSFWFIFSQHLTQPTHNQELQGNTRVFNVVVV